MIEIKITEELSNYIERLYREYIGKKDIITSLFELHKNDADASIFESTPYKHYEKLFYESKIAYDTAMKEINDTIVPAECRNEMHRFEVDFENHIIRVHGND